VSRPRLPRCDVTAGAAYHNKKKGSPVDIEEVRCGSCRKLLAKASCKRIQIKCPRCGTLNDMRAVEPLTRTPSSDSEEVVTHGKNQAENTR